MRPFALLAAVVFAFVSANAASAEEVQLTLKNMHICCGACTKAIEKAVDGVEGASVEVAAKEGQAVVTAADAKAARKALNALAKAGFHGETGDEKLAMKDDSGATEGKVRRAEVSGVHNCCGACTKAIKETLASVSGVDGDTVKPRAESFVVEGDFDPVALVKAFNKAGFHVKIKKAE
jgi:copper chaperone CopZ